LICHGLLASRASNSGHGLRASRGATQHTILPPPACPDPSFSVSISPTCPDPPPPRCAASSAESPASREIPLAFPAELSPSAEQQEKSRTEAHGPRGLWALCPSPSLAHAWEREWVFRPIRATDRTKTT